jgi:hypothetical protein
MNGMGSNGGRGVVNSVEQNHFGRGHIQLRRKKTMVNPTTPRFRSPYERRLELVKNTLTTYSALDDDAADKLAVHVLHALDTIPEKVR